MRRRGAGACAVLLSVTTYGVVAAARPGDPEPLRPDAETATDAPSSIAEIARVGAPDLRGASPAARAERERRAALAGEVRVAGRVVDERRRPIEGARVRRVGDPAPALVTDAAGRFAGRVPRERFPLTLHVVASRQRCALRGADLPSDASEVDAGTIEVRRSRTVRVAARGGGAALSGAHVTLMHADCGPPLCETRAGTDGAATFPDVPLGRVAAWADDGAGLVGRTFATVSEVRDLPEVEVEARPVRVVRLRVRGRDDAPVAGATVTSCQEQTSNPEYDDGWMPFPPALLPAGPPTGADGNATIRVGPPGLDLRVAVSSPAGWASESFDGDAEEFAFVVDRAARAEAVFPVKAGDAPVPPDGTPIRLGTFEPPGAPGGEADGFVRDGAIVIPEGAGAAGTIARTPSGECAGLERGRDGTCRPTSFDRPRRLTVSVLDVAEAPCPGAVVTLRHGNRRSAPRTADARGVVVFERLPATAVEVEGRLPDGGVGCTDVEARLGAGDAEATLHAAVVSTIVAEVTIDGVPGLPSGLGWDVSERVVASAEEDPALGTLTLRVEHPFGETAAQLNLSGRNVDAEGVPFTWPPDGTPLRIPVEMGPRGTVVAEVRGFGDEPVVARLEVLEDGRERWSNVYGSPHVESPTCRRFPGLRSGTYRMLDRRTGFVGAPFALAASGPPREVTFDVPAFAPVSGRVTYPRGSSPDAATVHVLSPLVTTNADAVDVDSTGAFSALVPVGSKSTVRVDHARLVADPARGHVEVDGARDGVELVLRDRSLVTLDLLTPEGAPLDARAGGGRLRAWTEEDGTDAALEPAGDGPGRFVVTGMGPLDGRLELDQPPYAIHVLGCVSIGEGTTSFPAVRLSWGSTVTWRTSEEAKRATLSGWCAGSRRSVTLAAPPWRLSGLARGSWYLTFAPEGGREQEAHVDVDGESPVVVTVTGD